MTGKWLTAIPLAFLFAFLPLVLLPSAVSAAPLINELLPDPSGNENTDEWVEIYNPDEISVDLAGYKLKDAAGHELVITADFCSGNTTVPAKGWLIVKRNNHADFSLNNSGAETVQFWPAAEANNPLDSFTYTDTTVDKSWGRVPDGGGIAAEKLDPTPGQANAPAPTPTATPVPLQTPTPNPTPSSSSCAILQPKDQSGNNLTNVKIVVDGQYIHHYAPETLLFCDDCYCDDGKLVECGYGEHHFLLEKDGYDLWSESRNINPGDSCQMDPRLSTSAVIPTSTPTPTPTRSPASTPTATAKLAASALSKTTPAASVSGSVLSSETVTESAFYPLESQTEPLSPTSAASPSKKSPAPYFILGGGGLILFAGALYAYMIMQKRS